MKPKPTPSIIAETRHSPDRIVGTITARSNKPRAKRRTKVSNPYRDSDFDDFFKAQGIYEEIMASPKLKKAIRDLGDSIQAGMHEAFAAGWNAFLATHSGLDRAWHQRFPSRFRRSVGQVLAEPERQWRASAAATLRNDPAE
jgi:hypothetical protein